MAESITIVEYARRRRLDASAGAGTAEPAARAVTVAPSAPMLDSKDRQDAQAALSELSSRARLAAAQAEEAEIRTARAAGRVLDRESTERGVFEAFRELRDAAFAMVRAQAPTICDLTEPREIQLALEDALRSMFVGWEERMQAKLDARKST